MSWFCEDAEGNRLLLEPSGLGMRRLDAPEFANPPARRTSAGSSAAHAYVACVFRLRWAAETGDREEAIRRDRAALAVDGSNAMALNNLAYTLAASEPDEALKYAQQAVELAPGNATLADTLGWIYYKKTIHGTAVTYLQRAVAKEPTKRRQFHLAISYLKSVQRDQGEKMLQSALRQDPKLR